MVVRVKPGDDDMAAFVETQPEAAGKSGAAQHLGGPRPRDVDQDAGGDLALGAILGAQDGAPNRAVAARREELDAGQDFGAMTRGVASVGDDEFWRRRRRNREKQSRRGTPSRSGAASGPVA